MAHKKGAGSTKNGRDSNAKRLGIKLYGNQPVNKGAILVRQRGLTFKPGKGVRVSKDFTIFATKTGFVKYKSYNNGQLVSVYANKKSNNIIERFTDIKVKLQLTL